MAYFNYIFAAQKGITPQDITNLQLISQNRSEDLSEYIEKYVNTASLTNYQEKGLIEYVKPKKKSDTAYNTIRLSGKGKELLELIYTPNITEGDKQLFDYLVQMYFNEDAEDRKIGNKKNTLMYISQFRQIMGFSLHETYYLCSLFCAEEKFTKIMEYVFFNKKDNPYGKFKDNIESSKLHIFYETNKERIHEYWKRVIKEE